MGDKDKVHLNSLEKAPPDSNITVEIKAYKRRWLILVIFLSYASINSFQWIEYSIITNIVMRYYKVSSVTVNWTAIIYMALYPPLVIPASYILDKKGLRTAALIGCIGTAAGTAIKVFSIAPDRFWIVLIGQAFCSASQLLILCIPTRIAAVWFKPDEVSTACSLGVFGTLLGCALGFVIPPMIVKNHENAVDIGPDLNILCWGLTIAMIPSLLAVIFYFPEHPPKPPSITQYRERNTAEKFTMEAFLASLKVLMKNKPFVTHMIAYGINIGVFSAISPLLNELVLEYFENAEEDAGRMGLGMIMTGILGAISFGYFLDRTHKYKQTTLFIYLMCALSVFGFMFALEMKSKILVYISTAVVGLFTNAYMPIGFELAMELTYPCSEGTTTGILMAPSQFLGVIFALTLGQLNQALGSFWALSSQTMLLVIGTIITACVPDILNRQAAFKDRRSTATELKLINDLKNNVA